MSTDEAASHLGHLRPGDERPPCVQIAAHLRELIDSGRLGPGDRLPSESQLTEHHGVARMTVRSALQVLESAGLTVARHGRGVFVRPGPSVRRLASDRFARRRREDGKAAFLAEAEKVGVRPTVDMIRVTREELPADIAERLATSPGMPVVVRRRRYLMDAGRSRPPPPTSRPTSPRAQPSSSRTPGRAASTPDLRSRATASVTSRRRSACECPPLTRWRPSASGLWLCGSAVPSPNAGCRARVRALLLRGPRRHRLIRAP